MVAANAAAAGTSTPPAAAAPPTAPAATCSCANGMDAADEAAAEEEDEVAIEELGTEDDGVSVRARCCGEGVVALLRTAMVGADAEAELEGNRDEGCVDAPLRGGGGNNEELSVRGVAGL